MASKMAVQQTLLVLLWVCLTVVVARCPTGCQCDPYKGRPSLTALSVDCSGRGLQAIPAGLAAWTKSLNMANNQLTAINSDALANLNLAEINLSGNNIQEIPSLALRIAGECNLDDFEFIKTGHVKFGRWNRVDLTGTEWPCPIDLRNNPISSVKPRAFAGSHNVTIFLGQSSTALTIETPAFGDTQHVIGIHISDVPKLNFLTGSMDGIINPGWIVFDKTEISFRDRIFSSVTNTRPHWFRISNSVIKELESDILKLNMDVSSKCDVTTNPYRPASVLTSRISTLTKGGVEFIGNTMPVLQTGLFRSSNIGGMYFSDNRIAGFEPGVFARDTNDEDICIIVFSNNRILTIPASLFQDVSVVQLIITERNVRSIEANAFAGSNSIGFLGISMGENQGNAQTVIKANAFSGINSIKILRIIALEHKLPRLVIEPFAFNGLTVEYSPQFWYDSILVLENDVFTGIRVNQALTITVTNLAQIGYTAFGRVGSGTSINRLEIDGLTTPPCDCEAVHLGSNLQQVVKGDLLGITCTATLDDGTVSNDEPLNSFDPNKTCTLTSAPCTTSMASGIQGYMFCIFLITICLLL